MTGLSFRSSTLPRRKTKPKGLHTIYACLSRVKPRCALTPACQKTNPKGLLSPFNALRSNYGLAIIVMLAHLIWPTYHSNQNSHPSTYKASHLISYLTILKVQKPTRISYSPSIPPQITPSGLVFWQSRVKVHSALTLPTTRHICATP